MSCHALLRVGALSSGVMCYVTRYYVYMLSRGVICVCYVSRCVVCHVVL